MDNLMSPFDMRNAVTKTLHRVVYVGVYWAELYWAVSDVEYAVHRAAAHSAVCQSLQNQPLHLSIDKFIEDTEQSWNGI